MIERYQNQTPSRPTRPVVEEKRKQNEKPVETRPKKQTIRNWFRKFAHVSAQGVGSPWAFFVSIALIVTWAITGPIFGFSDTWQLVINTATTIVTFLMVFLIQNTQNRDARAIHLKLDELLHSIKGARNRLISLEELTDEEMDHLQKEFERVRKKAAPLECEREKHQEVNEAEKMRVASAQGNSPS